MNPISALKYSLESERTAEKMYGLVERLYPICRSITGNGVRQSLAILQEHVPLRLFEVPSGTEVFDWTVPQEWNIRDAYIKRLTGERVVDFRECNLHVMGYSTPIHETRRFSDLRDHLFTLPDHPDWIPYRTSYYSPNWGFCLSHNQWLELGDEAYEVCIDSRLEDGYLTYAECFIPGEIPDEVLFSCHICHPSLCNDNLSGMALATSLAQLIRPLPLRYSYRFLFIPGTIGSITWLARNVEEVHRIKHGLVITSVGDTGPFTYKRSRQGRAEIDRAVEHVLRSSGVSHKIVDFSPYGYDERQYCSPGFNLPVGCLERTPYGQYPQYHTSGDNLDFVSPAALCESLNQYISVLEVLEGNRYYINTNPMCEPQLGKRGLYTAIGGKSDTFERQMAMLWVLNLSDGQHSLLDVAEKSGIRFCLIREMADVLVEHGLLKEAPERYPQDIQTD